MNKQALLNLQIMKKLALALLKHATDIYDCSLKFLRFRIAMDFEKEILRFFNVVSR